MGEGDWPFPIPLVHDAQGWYFDTAAGKEEIYNRRIGRNELSTIDTLRTYVDAQDEYNDEDRNGDGLKEYARHLMSTAGTHDGLYWPTAEGEPESPMGPLVADAVAEGYKPGEGGGGKPYHGYIFRALTSQGANAPGGVKDYLVDGHLTGGFALLAYPAEYGNSGIMSFQVNQSGIVYQSDLGPGDGDRRRRDHRLRSGGGLGGRLRLKAVNPPSLPPRQAPAAAFLPQGRGPPPLAGDVRRSSGTVGHQPRIGSAPTTPATGPQARRRGAGPFNATGPAASGRAARRP